MGDVRAEAELVLPSDDEIAEQYLATGAAAAAGYEQYEISNWATRRAASLATT